MGCRRGELGRIEDDQVELSFFFAQRAQGLEYIVFAPFGTVRKGRLPAPVLSVEINFYPLNEMLLPLSVRVSVSAAVGQARQGEST